ncbi:hypothetical protein [Ciceribacter selenitireducens]
MKTADLKRMADVAKAKNVTVWIEVDGMRIGVSPEMPALKTTKPLIDYEFDL